MSKVNVASFVKKLQRQGNGPAVVFSAEVEIGKYGEKVILVALSEDDMEAVERLGKLEDCKNAQQKSRLIHEQNCLAVYLGSPTLREVALELLKLEVIQIPVEVMNKFSKSDVAEMAKKVGELTLKANEPDIKEVEALKN